MKKNTCQRSHPLPPLDQRDFALLDYIIQKAIEVCIDTRREQHGRKNAA